MTSLRGTYAETLPTDRGMLGAAGGMIPLYGRRLTSMTSLRGTYAETLPIDRGMLAPRAV